MDLNALLQVLHDCPCGRTHTFDVKRIEIAPGLKDQIGAILADSHFEKRLLLVADRNTLAAADGILPSLKEAGFAVKLLVYENLLYARVEGVREVEALAADVDAILSVGTGSLNDICRVAAYECNKRFCIFATAPSMDGFASDTAPIIENNFKTSWQARQPEVILADTNILAAAPSVLKSAGFGDMIAKLIGLVDWKIAHLLIDEYYCDQVAAITQNATDRIIALADRITEPDPEAAGAVMEALILTGLAMKLAGCSRPASGAEHVISHYLECHKVIRGIWPEFHGMKVGVATLWCVKIYHALASRIDTLTPIPDPTDWDDVYAHFAPEMHAGVAKMNNPTVTSEVDPVRLAAILPRIKEIILSTLPTPAVLEELMKRAGAYTTAEEVHVDQAFMENALRYHGYMRHRLLITRLLPMLGQDPVELLACADSSAETR